jgi:hypothetical protein
MIERADGQRLLLAPSHPTADFVSGTYTFDAVHVVPVRVDVEADAWTVAAGPLTLRFTVGRRGPLGLLLRCVPGAVASGPLWSAVTYWPARLLPGRGVRTYGSAGAGRREWYAVRDLRPVATVSAVLDGQDLGERAPVEPPVRFGFGSVPRAPAVVRVVTTVESSQV